MPDRSVLSAVRGKLANVVLGLAFLVVLGLPVVFRPAKPARTGERELVVLSVHTETIRYEFERAFSQWTAETRGHTVRVDWLDVGGTNQAVKYVEDRFEKQPDGIGIDLFFGGGTDPFLRFSEEGLLARCDVPAEVLAPIPQHVAGTELYDRDRKWFGTCLAGFGLMYNKAVLEFLDMPQPQTWADLGRPGYFTWIASADPRLSGSIAMVYEIILQAYGWDEGWRHVMRIGGNCRAFSREASQVPADVAIGEAACGMAIDFYAQRAVFEAGADRLGFLLPRPLTVVNPDCIAMLKGAPHRELAELFIQFLLTERAQKLWMLRAGAPGGPREFQLYRLPVIPGLVERYASEAVVEVDPFAFAGSLEFDLRKKDARRYIMSDLFGALIIDNHDELAAAWNAVRNLPDNDPRMRELLAPPVAEAELMQLAVTKWREPRFRADTIARWSADARAKYKRLAEAN